MIPRQLLTTPLIIIGIMILALAAWQIKLLPGELAGLTCILVPAALSAWGGFVVGRYGRPRVSFTSEAPTAAEAGGEKG